MTVERESVGATHYEVLGVPRDADRQTIARAYRAAMRRLHPDAAEAVAAHSADELAAVQEAWRILQDADVRASYDRELATPSDVWSDLGWGVAVDVPDDEGSGTASPPGSLSGDGEDPLDAGDLVDPWRTPFVAGAVRIPAPPAPSGRPPFTNLDWVLVMGAAVFGLAAATMAVVWRDEVVTTSVAPGTPVPVAGLWLVGAMGAPLATFWLARSFERNSQERAAAFGVTGIGAVCALVLPWGFGLPALLLAFAGLGAVVGLVLAVGRRLRTVRRAAADEKARMSAYHRSAEWNRIREALRARGSRVEESHGHLCLDEPWRIRTVDPTTREESRRDVPGGLPRGAWVVVDKRGRVLATAPPGALEAWLACWGRTRADL